MKKLISAFIILIAIITFNPQLSLGQPVDSVDQISIEIEPDEQPLPPPFLTAEGAAVIDQGTGKVLFEKDEHKKLYPASTTKVLTAILAIELGDLGDMVTVGNEVNLIEWDGTKAGLVPGEQITLENLVYGLLINSGNDAANTIAVYIARRVSGEDLPLQEALNYFAELMNKRAIQAGALNSHFTNAHGYHNPEHYTTAYDLAMIGRAGMEHEFFRKAVSTTAMDTKYWNDGQPRYWRSKNKLLHKNDPEFYEYALGGKTGYTSKAGQCLISFAAKDGLDLVSVVFKSASSQQWGDTKKMFNYGFTNFANYQLLKKGAIVETLPVENYASDDWGSLAIEVESDDRTALINKAELSNIKEIIEWDKSVVKETDANGFNLLKLSAPIAKGQVIGQLKVMLGDEVLAQSNLTASRDVKKRTIIDIVKPSPDEASPKYMFFIIPAISVLLVLVLIRIIVISINRRRRSRYYF